jgi:hypothetical protein
MRQEAESLDKQAPRSPEPLGHRMEARARCLRQEADQHDRSRIILEEIR